MVLFKRFGMFLILALFALCIVFAGIWLASVPKSYRTAKVTIGKAVEAVYATAVVEPVTWAAIAPIKTGRIVEVRVEEGQAVEKGQILARLDDADLRKRYDEYKALEELQMAELERAQKLFEKGFASQETIDKRGSDLSQTIAARKRVEEEVRQMSLNAPRAGVVLWRDVEPGEVKQSGETVFWVGQPRPLRLEAEVDEEDIPKIKSGQTVLITADAFPGEVLDGVVHRISPKGDPVNKSYRVYVSLPEDTKLMIGMTVETNTIVQEKDRALLVPVDAMVDGPAFWVVQNGKAQKMDIKTGIRNEEQVEILDGIDEGGLVILPPFDDLSEGQDIQAR